MSNSFQLLYGFPVVPSAAERLSLISQALGPSGLSLIVDHPDQLPTILAIQSNTSIAPQIFLKIDMGARRAGVIPQTEACSTLIAAALSLESAGKTHLLGLYAHAGQSYYGSSRAAALDFLRQEFEALLVTATAIQSVSASKYLILSVGATPTTTSIRNLLIDHEDADATPTEFSLSLPAQEHSVQTQSSGKTEFRKLRVHSAPQSKQALPHHPPDGRERPEIPEEAA